MRITLQTLRISNFKGLKEFTFTPNGESVTIYGQNGAGKTTVGDALSWLLFGKNQAGDAQFEVKPLDADNKPIMGTAPTVEAVIEVEHDDPDYSVVSTITLAKTLKEQWVTKRGSREKVFEGNAAVYYIDEIEKKAGEYAAEIAELCREDVFRFVTSITHFVEGIDIKERRTMLVEMSGVTDESVMRDERFAGLDKIIAGRPFDGVVKLYRDKGKEHKTQLDALVISIKNVAATKPSDAECIPPAGTSYSELKAKLLNLQNRRSALLAGDTSEIQREITAKESEISQKATAHTGAVMDAEDKRRKLQQEITIIGPKITELEFKVRACRSENERLTEANVAGRKAYTELRDRKAAGRTCCPTCEQDLPTDNSKAADLRKKIEDALDKAIADNIAIGKANKVKIEENEHAIDKALAEIERLQHVIDTKQAEIDGIKDPEGPDMASMQAELSSLRLKLTAQGTPDTAKIDAETEAVEALIRQHDAASAANDQAGRVERKVAEMKQQQKAIGSELDEVDRILALLDEFTTEKMRRTEDAVSGLFAPCRFRLFRDQANGGYRDDCELLIPSREGAMVPYGKAGSNGERMAAGLRVVDALSRHFNVFAPVFVDNAESLTLSIPEMKSQLIRLYVQKGAAGLTVGLDAAEEATA